MSKDDLHARAVDVVTVANQPTQQLPEGRSTRKRQAILQAGTALFLENGYLGTSMDQIAASAAVSKQTVYKHFADKESLFSVIVPGAIDEYTDPYFGEVLNLQETGDLEADLRQLARRVLEMLMQPRLLRLRRLVIGEASRFPDLGKAYYERGPGHAGTVLGAVLERFAQRDLLELEDPTTAALHFNWSVISIPMNIAMFTGDDKPFSTTQLHRYADEGVKVFLAAYGHRQPPGQPAESHAA